MVKKRIAIYDHGNRTETKQFLLSIVDNFIKEEIDTGVILTNYPLKIITPYVDIWFYHGDDNHVKSKLRGYRFDDAFGFPSYIAEHIITLDSYKKPSPKTNTGGLIGYIKEVQNEFERNI